MKIQFQSGYGEVRNRIAIDNDLAMPAFYVAMLVGEAFGARGGSFEARAFESVRTSTPDIVVTYHPELTKPPLADHEVAQFIATLLDPEVIS